MMILAAQVLVVLGIGMVVYAVFEILRPQKGIPEAKKKNENFSPSGEDLGREQKIQRLQNRIVELEDESRRNKAEHLQKESEITTVKESELKFSDELKRREEWVKKAEAEVAKIKTENLDLSNKFMAKEKELEEEFAKNVNFSRQLRELKASLEEKEIACRLKDDQVQAQKHQIESQLKTIKENQVVIDGFNQKEKISEWVPKSEFNKLNEEYSALEKDLESGQERLKNFAEEISRLRKEIKLAEESPPEGCFGQEKKLKPKEEGSAEEKASGPGGE